MLVLLPPSETKRTGGDGPPLAAATLSFPELEPLRKELVDELVVLAADLPASRAVLGLSPRQDGEIERNAELWTSATAPALHRYTGVLYDALDAGSLRGAAAARAGARLAIGSALFGLLRATDPVPAYRLSAGSRYPAARRCPPAGGRCSTPFSPPSPRARRSSTCGPGRTRRSAGLRVR